MKKVIPGKIKTQLRLDGYYNVLNKYGTQHDSTEYYQWVSGSAVSDTELADLYAGNGLFSTIIDAPADDATKNGIDLGIKDKDLQKQIDNHLQTIRYQSKFAKALRWARLFGGAAVVMLVDDGRLLQDPLNWRDVHGVEELLVYGRNEMYPLWVNIAISEAMAIDGGYDTILIIGPLPKTPGGHMTPDVAGYTGTQDLKSAGFSTDDPVYIAASKVFAQSPKATMVMVAVQKTTSGSAEKVDVTLDRAKAVPGWYCICPAGIKEDFYQSIADWTESNEKFCVCETTGISASPVSDAMFRTAVIHATKENDCVNAAYAAKFLSYEPGSELWAYKSLSMVEAQSLSTTDIASLESRNVSYYTTIGSQAMVQGGKVSAGEWIDTIRFRDWLKTQIQQNVINLMLSLPKVPYTDPGIGLVQNAVTAALDAGVEAGGIARPSSDEATGTITPSYTITVPKAAELDAATRKTRVLPKVKWSAQLAGALIATEIGGTLNY